MRSVRLLCLLSVAAGLASAASYTVTDLGALGGYTVATGINNDGQVAGWGMTAQETALAFAFDGATMNSFSGSGETRSYGLNSAGQIVGVVETPDGPQATLWSGNTAVSLGSGNAMAINNSGTVVGGGGGQAFVVQNGERQEFRAGQWSAAYAVTDRGLVVGYSELTPGTFRAFLWDSANGIRTLGTLGGRSSYAFGVNDTGQVVGNSLTRRGYTHAYLYDGTRMNDLGTLGGTRSAAYGINSAGSVVGYSTRADGSTAAFLHNGGQMLDLNSLLLAPAQSWLVQEAYAINDLGQIVGTALLDGQSHAVRLDPVVSLLSAVPFTADAVATPEPSTMTLALCGVALVWLGRRKTTATSDPQTDDD